jgi:fumarate reductase subunit C
MGKTLDVIAGTGLDQKARKSRWPARLDVLQSASGLFLGLFMWGHMAFVSTILISKDTMWWVTKMFEGQFLFGKSYPGVVSAIVIVVSTRFVLHGALALRKVPANFRSTETSPAIEKCCATGYYALVGSGGHRFCATLFRFRAPLPDAHAPG